MPPLSCARCRRQKDDLRPVPRAVALLASVALAFAHGGMWASEELRKPYCARCRAVVIPTALGVAAVALALASVGVAIWLKGP